MSLYVLNTLGTNIGFSENQIKLLATMFEEAHDAGVDLEFAEMIEASSFGVLGKRTFQAVFEHVTGSQEAIAAHRYVKMVKDFIRSEAIQGVELKLD